MIKLNNMYFPEKGSKYSLLILDHDEIIGDSSQEINDNLMNYVSNLKKRINYTNVDIH